MFKIFGGMFANNENANHLAQNKQQKFNNAMYKRSLHMISGPPAHKFTPIQKILIGGGSMVIMSIIPLWGMFSIRSWSDKSKRLGKGKKSEEEEKTGEEQEEPEEAKPSETRQVAYRKKRS